MKDGLRNGMRLKSNFFLKDNMTIVLLCTDLSQLFTRKTFLGFSKCGLAQKLLEIVERVWSKQVFGTKMFHVARKLRLLKS